MPVDNCILHLSVIFGSSMDKSRQFLLLLCLFASALALAQSESKDPEERLDLANEISNRKQKVLFQVVRFKNEVCTSSSSSYNGTCYTSDECTNKGGSSKGSCASGFGVCCVFAMACGSTSSENNTYLQQSSVTTLTSPCTYTICPCSSNICRIRFDFTTHVIANPKSSTAATASVPEGVGDSLGDCVSDDFSITTPGFSGTPVICGTNTGKHMIVDASSLCHKATFKIGSTTGTSRYWDIRVTQYACGDTYGGPPGCLQYFTSTTGTISSFNFDTTTTSVSTSSQHLSSQCYAICIRRNSGKCSICYYQFATASFGLSNTPATGSLSAFDTSCTSDYLVIPGAVDTPLPAVSSITRFCGRIFSLVVAGTSMFSVCTKVTPFRVTFKTDADEVVPQPPGTPTIIVNELHLPAATTAGGTYGFALGYTQKDC